MSGKIETDAQFLASLDREQRHYFLAREAEHRDRLQAALRDLSRGFGAIGALHGEAVSATLAALG